MKIRVKNVFQNKDRQRTPEEIGGVLAFNLWKMAGANVLNLENEGFQTDTQSQRLDAVAEFLAFYVHISDRLAAKKEYAQEDRANLITATALSLSKTMQDNRNDINEGDSADDKFIEIINNRMSEYAGFSYDENEPGFQLRRRVGDHVTEVMGEKDRKWVTDQVMDIEIPEAMKVFRRITRNLL